MKMKNKILDLSVAGVNVASKTQDGYQRFSLRNLSAEITRDFAKGPVRVYCDEPSVATIFLEAAAGKLQLNSGSLLLTLDESKIDGHTCCVSSPPVYIPWLTVEENIKITLQLAQSKADKEDIRQALELTGLDGYETHIPHKKSYGFRARVALAACLAMHAKVTFIAALPTETGKMVRTELLELYEKINRLGNMGIVFGWASAEPLSIPHSDIQIKQTETGSQILI
jgi:ABC-type taurine transport system ATPase subunit